MVKRSSHGDTTDSKPRPANNCYAVLGDRRVAPDRRMTRVRIRGIYATALTTILNESFQIVQPSPPIKGRFDASFDVDDHDLAITTTRDREGVGITGTSTAVQDAVSAVAAIGRDTFTWHDPAPRGAMFESEVIEETERGVVVDLGPREGFLPSDELKDHVTAGDELRVQIHDPAPPWGEKRPTVSPTITVFGGIVDLVENGGNARTAPMDPERANELVRTTAMLPTTVPNGWSVRWKRGAAEADVDTLNAALDRAVARLEDVVAAVDGGEAPAVTVWIWFGRESRFVLDERRRATVATMPGHHRVKLVGERASAAVDFVERVCAPDEYPIGAVLDQFGPTEGDNLRIEHGKPDGRRFPLGTGVVVARDGATVTVERTMSSGGTYDALGTPREEGDTAVTKLKEGRWWYPTAYQDADGESKGMYVNVCTPVEILPNRAVYVDLEVDVVRHVTGTVERVDDDELDAAVESGDVSPDLAEKARSVATAVERALDSE